MPGVTFEILVDDLFSKVASDHELKLAVNKRLLSIANDFEDGKWRFPKFQSFIWDNIAETALSQREREALSHQPFSILHAAARNLRLTDKDATGAGSELAEVFLYGIMKGHFGAVPVVPKIFYKQNSQDNAKGADSVHIVIADEDFTLWFGEAKFYNSIEDARLDTIVKSVFDLLDSSKIKKENSIITNVSDIDRLEISTELRAKIRSALDQKESLDKIRSKINIPILIIHECDITSCCTELSETYKKEITALHLDRANAYFKKQKAKAAGVYKYDEVKFHLILFPVPDKSAIVSSFLKKVEMLKEAS